MKKALFLILVLVGLSSNQFAQKPWETSQCAMTCFDALGFCLDANAVMYTMTYTDNEVTIYGEGVVPPGKINSCIAQYNQNRSSCPSAPVVVNGTPITLGRVSGR